MTSKKEVKRAIFCIPIYSSHAAPRPHQATLDSLRDTVPLLEAAGWEHATVHEINCPYISAARATMLHKALAAGATHIVFIDSDVSWRPEDMLKLLEAEGDAVAGTYRFKKDDEEYMGNLASDAVGRPIVRESDGAIKSTFAPAGFLRVTRYAVNKFMETYPELCYGEHCAPAVDLFNHGAHARVWEGEDAGFSRRWTEKCGDLWIIPDMNIDHHGREDGGKVYRGNLHRFLRRQPGGSESDCPISPAQLREQTLAKIAKSKAA